MISKGKGSFYEVFQEKNKKDNCPSIPIGKTIQIEQLAKELGRYGVFDKLFLGYLEIQFQRYYFQSGRWFSSIEKNYIKGTLFEPSPDVFLFLDNLELEVTLDFKVDILDKKIARILSMEQVGKFIQVEYEVDPIIERSVDMKKPLIYQKALQITKKYYDQIK